MKKYFQLLILANFLLISNVQASSNINRYFVGGGLQTALAIPGPAIFAGYRGEKYGVEGGYNLFLDSQTIKGSELLQNIYFDGLYFYSLSNKLDLKTRLGAGLLLDKYTNGNNMKRNSSSFGLRLGTGLQYQVSKHVEAGAGVAIQTVKFFNGFLPIPMLSLNLAYYF